MLLQTQCVNTSGQIETDEGPDFKLDAKNKITQNLLPPHPKGEDWERVYANEKPLINIIRRNF